MLQTSNFERLTPNSKISNNSLIVLPKEKASEYSKKIKDKRSIDTFRLADVDYLVYK